MVNKEPQFESKCSNHTFMRFPACLHIKVCVYERERNCISYSVGSNQEESLILVSKMITIKTIEFKINTQIQVKVWGTAWLGLEWGLNCTNEQKMKPRPHKCTVVMRECVCTCAGIWQKPQDGYNLKYGVHFFFFFFFFNKQNSGIPPCFLCCLFCCYGSVLLEQTGLGIKHIFLDCTKCQP